MSKTKAEIIALMQERQKEIPDGVSIHDYHLRSIEIMFDVAATILEECQDRDEYTGYGAPKFDKPI